MNTVKLIIFCLYYNIIMMESLNLCTYSYVTFLLNWSSKMKVIVVIIFMHMHLLYDFD